MIDLSGYIYELLHTHECVVVPELGGFIIRKKNAVIYVAQNLFAPPSKHLHFNAQLTHNDGLLAHHISKATGISYEKTMEDVSETVSEILYQLYKGKSVVFNNIGTISHQNGFFKFESSTESDIQDESYGLNSFIMPILHPTRERKRPMTVRKERKKSQRSPIKAYRIAAVIAFLILGIGGYFLKTEPVQDYVKSSLYPQIHLLIKDFFTEKQPVTVVDNTVVSEEQPVVSEEQPVVSEEQPVVSEGEEDTDIAAIEETEIVAQEEMFSEETAAPTITNVSENNLMQPPTVGQYYIIIGAFKNSKLAENLCKQMRDNGYHSTTILDIPASTYRRVSLQSFDNLTSAQKSLIEVQQKIQEDAWVMKWNN